MTDDPLFSTRLMALGGQFAQAWQKTLEAWWQGLLGDRERLRQLARQLADLGGEGTTPPGAEDISRLVRALELLERRQHTLEAKVDALAENLEAVVTYLERSGESAVDFGGTASDKEPPP